MNKPFIYVSGPLSTGDVKENIKKAIEVAEAIRTHDGVPYVPHLTQLWHDFSPHPWEWWMDYDKDLFNVCHFTAVYRIPGESRGAEEEKKWAEEMQIPYFTDLQELINFMVTLNKVYRAHRELAKMYRALGKYRKPPFVRIGDETEVPKPDYMV